VFLGDSLTTGFAASQEQYRYVARVGSALSVPTISMDTSGISAVEVAANHPMIPTAQVVVIELGTNDYSGFAAPSPSTLAQFHDAYLQLMTTARASGHLVACLGLWQPTTPNSIGLTSSDYDSVIASLCPRYIPIQALFDDGAYHGPAGLPTWLGTSDKFHPNDAGHAAIAHAVEQGARFIACGCPIIGPTATASQSAAMTTPSGSVPAAAAVSVIEEPTAVRIVVPVAVRVGRPAPPAAPFHRRYAPW
jgi:lysophospholipase L1-like esterase